MVQFTTSRAEEHGKSDRDPDEAHARRGEPGELRVMTARDRLFYVKVTVYLVVIAVAAVLREPWMIAVQAGTGGAVLGLTVGLRMGRVGR